jgi:DNA-binding beta-propeller fold protein YncE
VASLQPGDVFAGHRIEEVAGQGGMGVVYRATQLDLDRTVALKVIAPAQAQDPDFRARFVRECRVAASIDHPNVLPVYAAGETDGVLYLTMRFVEGDDLRGLVRRERQLPPERAAHVVAQIAAALDAAHVRGVVHRDVKPANVLLGADDHAYLTDFGLTRRLQSHTGTSRTGQWVGTLGYVAPEQIRGERVDARADVYALGCVLFHALTGVPPYRRDGDEATLWAHLHDPPPPVTALTPGVPSELEALIERALAKHPDDRFPSAGDLGRAALTAVGRAGAPGPERLVAQGAAAPGEAWDVDAPTAGSPTQTPTHVLAGDGAGRAGGARRAESSGGREGADGMRRDRRSAVPSGPVGIAIAALLGAAVVIGLGLLLVDGRGHDNGSDAGRTPSAAGVARPAVSIGGRPNGLAVTADRVFAITPTAKRISVLDPAGNRRVRRPTLAGTAGMGAIASAYGSLWVIGRDRVLLRIDPHTGRRRSATPLPPDVVGLPVRIVASGGAIWVAVRGQGGAVVRLDPRGRKAPAIVRVRYGIQDMDVGAGYVWVTNRERRAVTRLTVTPSGIDPGTRRTVTVAGQAAGIVVGLGYVWVAVREAGAVTQIEPGSLNTVEIPVGHDPTGIAVGAGAAWVSNYGDHTISRIDPVHSTTVGEPIPVRRNPKAVAVRGLTVWVASVADGAVQRVDASPLATDPASR